METNTEIALAWELIENTGTNLFLTGKAGTGKTTFLKELKRLSPKRMVVLAPTGISAINAGGVTIHSFFQLPLSPYLPGITFDRTERRYFRFSKIKKDIIRTLDLLVIDEISMVRADLLDAVDAVMRRYRDYSKPFGGVQLLMIGDLQQLAPVLKDEEWALLKSVYATPYFFSSKALALAGYHTIELKTVYRQQDTSFISLLNQIRENKATDGTFRALNRRYIKDFKPDKDSDYIRLTTHNYQAQAINDRELSLLHTKEYVFEAEVQGVFPEMSYPADNRLVLKEGAQIMFIKNDASKRFYNGMIGEVVSLSVHHILVRGKGQQEPFYLEKAEWTNSKYTLDDESKEIKETVEGVFRQYPLRLAWAITIHKSQGLTFEHAIIDVSHSFAHGQTYVALSRCKSLNGLVLSAPLQRESIISDSLVDTFITDVKNDSLTQNEMSVLKREYIIRLLDELFNFSSLQSSFGFVLRTLDEHFYRKYPKLLAEYKRVGLMFNEFNNVSGKFASQYTRLVNGLAYNGDDSLLQERVHKAAEYFSSQLKELDELCRKTKVESDNKTAKKQFDERFSTFSDEFTLKKRLLDYESRDDVSFSTSDYLKRKAYIILGLSSEKQPKNGKKEKVAKEPKVPTKQISYDLFKSGLTVGQVAKERGLTVDTIMGHLVFYVKEGMIRISDVMPQEHINELDSYFMSHQPAGSFSSIKAAVNPSIIYSEIRLYMNVMGKGTASD